MAEVKPKKAAARKPAGDAPPPDVDAATGRAATDAAPIESPPVAATAPPEPAPTADDPAPPSIGNTQQTVGLVDENGKKVKAADLFTDEDPTKTFVTVKKRVYEQFNYRGATTVATRLLFVEGRRVPRYQAEQIKAATDG